MQVVLSADANGVQLTVFNHISGLLIEFRTESFGVVLQSLRILCQPRQIQRIFDILLVTLLILIIAFPIIMIPFITTHFPIYPFVCCIRLILENDQGHKYRQDG